MFKQIPGLIYESPDGGNTIYARESGKSERKLVHISNETIKMKEVNNALELWKKIIELSLTDENLAYELERVKMLFYLKTNGSKT